MSIRACFYLFCLFCLTSCWRQNSPPQQTIPNKGQPLTILFQNQIGLELHVAGCSILNYGGIDRFCEYRKAHPADATFQIGPSFSYILSSHEGAPLSEIQQKRRFLWKEWAHQKIAFYSVDWQDLVPSKKAFDEISDSRIPLISANLFNADASKRLYQPFFQLNWGKHSLVFVSFAEPTSETSLDWKVKDPATVFTELLPTLPQDVSGYYIVGSLKPGTREKLAQASNKPLFFLSAELSRPNSTDVEEEKTFLLAKVPDLGRGVGTLIFTEPNGANAPEYIKSFNHLNHEFRAKGLRDLPITDAHCKTLLPEQIQECQIRKLGDPGQKPCDDK